MDIIQFLGISIINIGSSYMRLSLPNSDLEYHQIFYRIIERKVYGTSEMKSKREVARLGSPL